MSRIESPPEPSIHRAPDPQPGDTLMYIVKGEPRLARFERRFGARSAQVVPLDGEPIAWVDPHDCALVPGPEDSALLALVDTLAAWITVICARKRDPVMTVGRTPTVLVRLDVPPGAAPKVVASSPVAESYCCGETPREALRYLAWLLYYQAEAFALSGCDGPAHFARHALEDLARPVIPESYFTDHDMFDRASWLAANMPPARK